jgi:type II secretory pathway pseudopilin PulG
MVLTLMVILVLSVMASGLMYNIVNEKTITANRMRSSQALALAKAGQAEAIARLSIPYSNSNDTVIVQDINGAGFTPNWRCYISLDQPGSAGTTDIVYKKTVQTSANQLNYSEDFGDFGDTSSVLQVRYKHFDLNNDGTLTGNEVYYYDYKRDMTTLGKAAPTPADAYPVWEIISTGKVGNSRRTLVTEVVVPRFTAKTRAGLSSHAPVVGSGNADVCGHDHPTTTPYNTSPPTCFDAWHVYAGGNPHGLAATNFSTYPAPRQSCIEAGCVPGIESDSIITDLGANKKSWGNPDYVEKSNRPIYKIWDIMGMDSATCWNLPWGTDMYPVNGLVRVGSPGGSTMYAGHGAGLEHMGILWVRGDLHSSSNLAVKGLIYVEEDFRSTGTTWVLGGIVVLGETETRITGSIDVLYSSEMIARVVQQATGVGMKVISQREVDEKFN